MFPLKDENPTVRRPIVTIAIMALCVVVFFGPQRGLSSDPLGSLEFNLEWAAIPCELKTGEPLSEQEVSDTFNGGDANACRSEASGPERYPDKSVWLSVIASMFMHGGLMHIGGNMLFLWIFGNNIEDRLGHVPYLIFYLLGGISATIAHVAVQTTSTIPVVGASGAVAAIMGAYALWFPNAPVRTIVFYYVRDISAKWFLGIWFITQFFTGANSGVAWMAHVGGFVFGAVVALIVRVTGYGKPKITGWQPDDRWDDTGGIGRGPLPHPFDSRRGY